MASNLFRVGPSVLSRLRHLSPTSSFARLEIARPEWFFLIDPPGQTFSRVHTSSSPIPRIHLFLLLSASVPDVRHALVAAPTFYSVATCVLGNSNFLVATVVKAVPPPLYSSLSPKFLYSYK
jgi:hypothetical protein